MPQRDGYLPGVPCWIDTSEPDAQVGLAFYEALFGWEFEDVMPPEAPGHYYIGRLNGGDVAAISSQPDGEQPPAAWSTYVWVDSVDDSAKRVYDAGGSVLMEPFDVMDAGRMAVFADPEGAEFRVWQAGQHKGAQIVNDPGSLNFNTLNVRDVARATSFYGAVFGWDTLDLPNGAQMWVLPGYAEDLERDDPGLRARVVEVGAPEGFADVVAAINPLGPDAPDTPAHWGVTFAVEDADATAAKATELGGRVVVPPFDAPWVRMTVISDPHGAMFTASKFVPENRDVAFEANSRAAA
jgi:predicted enzyme related to lactoylglutathione lyase